MIAINNKIIDKRTRTYMKEVISSYNNECYRSANVLLYSVVICDLLYKLEELKEIYNDKNAKRILEEINKTRKSSDKTEWEKVLVDRLYNETELIDDLTYSHIERLKKERNFCAHPSMSDDYSLVFPSKEITIANITDMIDDVFSKPAFLISKVTDLLLDDISEKKNIYNNDYKMFKQYLCDKYYNKMNVNMKLSLYKSLWKICFVLMDEDCVDNREINFLALRALSELCIKEVIDSFSNDDKLDFTENDVCCYMFFNYLSYFPEIYKILKDDVKFRIEKRKESDNKYKLLSWFIENDLKNHLKMLINSDVGALYRGPINRLYNESLDHGYINLFYDFCICSYERSNCFDMADDRFHYLIEPYLNQFDDIRIKSLLKTINSNDQIYGRREAYQTNTIIMKRAIIVLGDDYNYEQYNNIDYDKNDLHSQNMKFNENTY